MTAVQPTSEPWLPGTLTAPGCSTGPTAPSSTAGGGGRADDGGGGGHARGRRRASRTIGAVLDAASPSAIALHVVEHAVRARCRPCRGPASRACRPGRQARVTWLRPSPGTSTRSSARSPTVAPGASAKVGAGAASSAAIGAAAFHTLALSGGTVTRTWPALVGDARALPGPRPDPVEPHARAVGVEHRGLRLGGVVDRHEVLDLVLRVGAAEREDALLLAGVARLLRAVGQRRVLVAQRRQVGQVAVERVAGVVVVAAPCCRRRR